MLYTLLCVTAMYALRLRRSLLQNKTKAKAKAKGNRGQCFDAVEPQIFDRSRGGKEQIRCAAQDVQAQGQEPGRSGAHGPGQPEALRAPVGHRQETAEAGGEAGEEQTAGRRPRLMLHHKRHVSQRRRRESRLCMRSRHEPNIRA